MESDAPCVPAIERAEDGRWTVREGARWPMPRNLFLVGTVNVDETTHPFSPKVLDRAHTFELRVATSDLRLTPRRPHAAARARPAWLRALSEASQQEAALAPAGVIEPVAQVLRVAHGLLTEAGLEFGHRVFHESLRFAALHAAMGEPSADVALDEVLMQKVLVRLQGSRRQLEGLLDALGRLCVDPAAPDPWRGADPFGPQVSPRLGRSHRKLAQLRRALREQPYAHYFG
jgi:5-methylcytosine-specific restriction protein B